MVPQIWGYSQNFLKNLKTIEGLYMDLEFIKCNYCGSESSKLFINGRDYSTSEKDDTEFILNTCEKCGLIYQNPRPTSLTIQKYYPDSYSPYNNKSKYLKLFNRISNNEKKCVLKFIRSGNLIDVGCASGYFLHEMQQTGQFNLTGVEFSSYASQRAREEHGLDVFTGNLEAANLQAGQYDVVTMWNVLEHVYDPVGTVNEVFRILRPGGFFIVRVPNPNSLAAKLFGRYWAGLDLPRHLFLFPKNVLKSIAQEVGFFNKRHLLLGIYVAFKHKILVQ